jgi:hypothetical protein
MPATLTADQRFARLDRAFVELGRRHLALEKQYLELVKIIFDMRPPLLPPHQREILARHLEIKDKQ